MGFTVSKAENCDPSSAISLPYTATCRGANFTEQFCLGQSAPLVSGKTCTMRIYAQKLPQKVNGDKLNLYLKKLKL